MATCERFYRGDQSSVLACHALGGGVPRIGGQACRVLAPLPHSPSASLGHPQTTTAMTSIILALHDTCSMPAAKCLMYVFLTIALRRASHYHPILQMGNLRHRGPK